MAHSRCARTASSRCANGAALDLQLGLRVTRVIVGLPVDARPAVRSQVQQMVSCAGWALRLPPLTALGHFRVPADRDALAGWLMQQAAHADAFVLSLDMLVYGGLVPSRFIADPLQALLQRLAVVEALHAAAPGKPIHAFAATMRISNNDVADEEKPYWSTHGRRLWAWSHHGDHARSTGDAASAALAAAAEAHIPQAVRDDYTATRARNHAVTRAALGLVSRGVIARLVLPQDDTAQHGINIAERRALQGEVTRLGLQERVAIHPGADEVMHTLCARTVATLEGRAPLRVALAPSDPQHIGRLHALYEDRPLLDSIASQVDAVGAVLVDAAAAADLLLAVHTQGCEQGDWAMQRALPARVPIEGRWFDTLRGWQRSGRPLALADLAFANGGDPWLLGQPALPPPAIFSAYAGWNTASNSLGSVLAQSVLAFGREHEAAARQALALRWLEDLQYQGVLRQALRREFEETATDPSTLLDAARRIVLPPLNAWAKTQRLGFAVADLAFPWGRIFEIDLQLEPAA